MTQPKFPLETSRMHIRPDLPEDFDFLYDLYQRPDVVRYLPWDVQDKEGIKALIDGRLGQETLKEEGDKLNLMCLEKQTGAPIGEVGLFLRSKEHKMGEVGYVIHPDHAGKGFAREGAHAMLKLGFEMFDMHRIIARCDARNLASEAVMKSLGMRHEATLIENMFENGEWTDETDYAILQREWRG